MSHGALDSIIMVDSAGRIVDFHPLAKATLAYRRADVVGCQLADVIAPPRLRDAHRAELARCLQEGVDGTTRHRLELHGIRSDGSECAVELTLMATAVGEGTAFTRYLREVTDSLHERQDAPHEPRGDLTREPAARQQVDALSGLAEELATALTEEDVARVAVDRGRRVMVPTHARFTARTRTTAPWFS
jgi:PAS domain S-box-containing protein